MILDRKEISLSRTIEGEQRSLRGVSIILPRMTPKDGESLQKGL